MVLVFPMGWERIHKKGAFHFGTIAEGLGQPRGDCPYQIGNQGNHGGIAPTKSLTGATTGGLPLPNR